MTNSDAQPANGFDPVLRTYRKIRSALASVPGMRGRPQTSFWSSDYIRHNQRRQEHLATLGLPLAGKTVIEVGAGIGDHTSFFIDRGCQVIITEGRPANLAILKRKYPDFRVELLDLDNFDPAFNDQAEIVYCYGTLYHLRRPAQAMAALSKCCTAMLLLETCVSFGTHLAVNLIEEPSYNHTQAVSGIGCRPTRPWIYTELKRYFDYVYFPVTQPWHKEFPIDWLASPTQPNNLSRAVFIASREPIANELLTDQIPMKQRRC